MLAAKFDDLTECGGDAEEWEYYVLESFLVLRRTKIKDRQGNIRFERWGIETPLFNIYIHHFLYPDKDGHPHDHPWSFLTFILCGAYLEWTKKGLFWRKRGTFKFNPASEPHQVVATRAKNGVWTLVFTGPTKRIWGYHLKYPRDGSYAVDSWIPNDHYRNLKNAGQLPK